MSDVESLRRAMQAEAEAFAHRRHVAGMLAGTTAIGVPDDAKPDHKRRRDREAPDRDEDAHTADGRDPCSRCGVRRDVHDAHGCKRWREG